MSIKVEKCLALLSSQNLQHMSWVLKEFCLYLWLLSTILKGWGECFSESRVNDEVVVQLCIEIHATFPRGLQILLGKRVKKICPIPRLYSKV